MSALTSEQFNKLKNAVKSKLIEIGEYIDDQLTDYIMIMVTNKKSQKQIAEDLEIFLGGIQAATNFSTWLHSVLNQIDNISNKSDDRRQTISSGLSHSASADAANGEELALEIDTNEFNDDFTNEESRSLRSSVVSMSNGNQPSATTPKPKEDNKSAISSFIGAVIKHEHEVKPKRRSSTLSSIVKVTERPRHKLSKELQANKSILLKAVDEANSSVKKKPNEENNFHQKHDDHHQHQHDHRQPPHYHNRNYDQGNGVKRMRDNNFDASKRRVQLDEELDRMSALKTLDTNKRLVVEHHESINAPSTSERANEPKFIITLSGLDEDKFLKRKFKEIDEVDEATMDHEQLDEGVDMEESNDTEDKVNKKKLIRCSFWPMCEKGDFCPYLHPNKPCTAFPNCQFGQLCHYLHPTCRYDGFCTRIDCPFTHEIKKPMHPPVAAAGYFSSMLKKENHFSVHPDEVMTATTASSIVSENTLMEETENLTQTSSIPNDSTIAQKPTMPKITINKIQPFNMNYNTRVQQGSPQTGINKTSFCSSQYSIINRSNSSNSPIATAKLQINCKFGASCLNPKCAYIHPNLPPKSQLKWVSPSLAQQQQQTHSQLATNQQEQVHVDDSIMHHDILTST